MLSVAHEIPSAALWGLEVKDEEVPERRGSCPGSCGMAWAGQEGRPERLGEVWAGGRGDTFSLNYPGAPQSLEGESLMQTSRPSVLTELGRCRSQGLALLTTLSLVLCSQPCFLPSPEDQHLDRPSSDSCLPFPRKGNPWVPCRLLGPAEPLLGEKHGGTPCPPVVPPSWGRP